ncbi:hypothetical protein NIES4103_14150 [Nostoc sp. NIES-4103]|nr:hypothetical protein NIES4103_14150 [Nostoc sp. NIES-4103]
MKFVISERVAALDTTHGSRLFKIQECVSLPFKNTKIELHKPPDIDIKFIFIHI